MCAGAHCAFCWEGALLIYNEKFLISLKFQLSLSSRGHSSTTRGAGGCTGRSCFSGQGKRVNLHWDEKAAQDLLFQPVIDLPVAFDPQMKCDGFQLMPDVSNLEGSLLVCHISNSLLQRFHVCFKRGLRREAPWQAKPLESFLWCHLAGSLGSRAVWCILLWSHQAPRARPL